MNILITGATGLVATEYINLLLNTTDHRLILLSRTPEKTKDRYQAFSNRIVTTTLEDLIEDTDSLHVDVCIHTAFARSSKGIDVSKSLLYLCKLADWIKTSGCFRFINISSQSVYGSNYTPYATETEVCNPDYMYALGKYSSELLCNEIFKGCNVQLLNIRLASVVENARFMKVFVENAISGNPIKVVAPQQIVSFIDVRDVASALKKTTEFKGIVSGEFNLGTSQCYTIKYVAEMVKSLAQSRYSISDVNIIIEDNGNDLKVGMDSSKFQNIFDWSPEFSLSDMISSLFEMLTNVNEGGYPISFRIVYKLVAIQ